MRIIPLYPTKPSEKRTAFYTSFGIKDESVKHDFRVENGPDGKQLGCNVASVTLCTHCAGPHLEVVSHIVESAYPAKVSDAIESDKLENAILITPEIGALGESVDTYPVGTPGDIVVSRRALVASLGDGKSEGCESVIIRIPETAFSIEHQTGEIRDWPYLTVEAAAFLHSKFRHVRTNAPSIEKQYSEGGMWSHAIFFGVDANRSSGGNGIYEARTVGELFHLPNEIGDGKYMLVCPFHEVGIDCALTLPFLMN